MRTTCCRAACAPPARMRVLTGVRYSRARTMWERSTPRWKLASRRPPPGSAPRRPTRHAAAWEAASRPPPRGIGADEADEARRPAERGDVVRGVAGAAGDHLGGVV